MSTHIGLFMNFYYVLLGIRALDLNVHGQSKCADHFLITQHTTYASTQLHAHTHAHRCKKSTAHAPAFHLCSQFYLSLVY